LVLISLFFAWGNCEAENPVDLNYKIRAVGENRELRDNSVFALGLPLTSFGKDRGRLEGEVRGRAGPLSLQVTETVSKQAGSDPTSRALINQAYFDFGEGELRGSAGKKVLSYDVGYAFRPLDLLQREARLQVLPPALEGVNQVTIERFSAERAVGVIVANPGNGREPDPKDDGSASLRYYQRAGTADLHGTARYSERFRLEAGAAFSAVPHESLELHGSALYQQRSERTAPAVSPTPQALLAPDGALVTRRSPMLPRRWPGLPGRWKAAGPSLAKPGTTRALPARATGSAWRRKRGRATPSQACRACPAPRSRARSRLDPHVSIAEPVAARRPWRIAWTDPAPAAGRRRSTRCAAWTTAATASRRRSAGRPTGCASTRACAGSAAGRVRLRPAARARRAVRRRRALLLAPDSGAWSPLVAGRLKDLGFGLSKKDTTNTSS